MIFLFLNMNDFKIENMNDLKIPNIYNMTYNFQLFETVNSHHCKVKLS